MKILLTFSLCLFAVVANAANPSTKSFRATGGLAVTSNDITGVITYDGSGISGGSATNAQPPSTTLSNMAANAYTGYTNFIPNALFVETNGNNATARKGYSQYPWRDPTSANSNAIAGDIIKLGIGTFNIESVGTNNIQLAHDVSLIGSGTWSTWLVSTGELQNVGPLIAPGSRSTIADLSTHTHWGTITYHAGIGSLNGLNSAFTNSVVRNVNMWTDTDGVYVSNTNRCSADFYNCYVNSKWDSFLVLGNSNHFFRGFSSSLYSDPRGSSNTANNGPIAKGLRNASGIVEWHGGSIIATNGDGAIDVVAAISPDNTGTHTNIITRLYGVYLGAAGTNAAARIDTATPPYSYVTEYLSDTPGDMSKALDYLSPFRTDGTNVWQVQGSNITTIGRLTVGVMAGSGDHVAVTAGGTLLRTNIAGGGGSNYLFDAAVFNAVAAAGTVNVGIKSGAIMPGFYADTGILYGGGVLDYGLYYDTGVDMLYYQDARFAPNYTNIFGISNGFANFFISPRMESIPAGSLLRTDSAKRIAVTTIGANLTWDGTTLAGTGGGTGASTNQVLTNLIGTVTRNVTNVVSLSTSNATSKPLTNSYTDGVLTLRGLEAGANTTITANGSNFVIASTGGGGLAGHSNAIAYINPQGTALTYYDTGNSMTNPGFGFNPTTLGGPHGGYAGLMVFANDPLGLVTIGHPNPGADFSTYATALVVSNRFNSAGGYKNDMIKFDAVIVNGGNLQSDSTLTRWRVWQAPSGGGASTSSNDVAEVTVGGDLKLAGSVTTGVGGAGNGVLSFGTNFTMLGTVSSNSSYERTLTNATPGVMVALPVVAGVTNQRVNITLTAGQFLGHNGTTYVAQTNSFATRNAPGSINYTNTSTLTNATFGSSMATNYLPTAGTYLVLAQTVISGDAAGVGDIFTLQLWSTNGLHGVPVIATQPLASAYVPMTTSAIVTVYSATAVYMQLSGTGSRGVAVYTWTAIRSIKL